MLLLKMPLKMSSIKWRPLICCTLLVPLAQRWLMLIWRFVITSVYVIFVLFSYQMGSRVHLSEEVFHHFFSVCTSISFVNVPSHEIDFLSYSRYLDKFSDAWIYHKIEIMVTPRHLQANWLKLRSRVDRIRVLARISHGQYLIVCFNHNCFQHVKLA